MQVDKRDQGGGFTRRGLDPLLLQDLRVALEDAGEKRHAHDALHEVQVLGLHPNRRVWPAHWLNVAALQLAQDAGRARCAAQPLHRHRGLRAEGHLWGWQGPDVLRHAQARYERVDGAADLHRP